MQERFEERWQALVAPKLAEEDANCRADEAIVIRRRMDAHQVSAPFMLCTPQLQAEAQRDSCGIAVNHMQSCPAICQACFVTLPVLSLRRGSLSHHGCFTDTYDVAWTQTHCASCTCTWMWILGAFLHAEHPEELVHSYMCCRLALLRSLRRIVCTCCTTLRTCACALAMPRAYRQQLAKQQRMTTK